MVRRMIMAGLAGAVVLGGAAAGGTAASATPVCASASTTGTVTGSNQFGPACAPYPYPVSCGGTSAGASPQAVITLSYCIPAP